VIVGIRGTHHREAGEVRGTSEMVINGGERGNIEQTNKQNTDRYVVQRSEEMADSRNRGNVGEREVRVESTTGIEQR
jgi:hypothetical protein